jgi:hypothetical protein
MNTPTQFPDNDLERRLHDTLRGAQPGTGALHLIDVRRRASQRRRHRSLAVGVACAAATTVAVGGLALRSAPDARLVSGTDSVGQVDAATTGAADVSGSERLTGPPIAAPASNDAGQVVPWRDGFLSVNDTAGGIDARFSADGTSWVQVPFQRPGLGTFDRVVVAGDRLMVLEVESTEIAVNESWGIDRGRPVTVDAVHASWTADLVNWTTESLVLPSTDSQAPLRAQRTVTAFVATSQHWTVSVETRIDVDWDAVLPAEVPRDRAMDTIATEPTGVLVEYRDDAGTVVSTSYSWQQLGIEPPPAALATPPTTQHWASDIGASPVVEATASQPSIDPLASTVVADDRFVRLEAGRLIASANGVDWDVVAEAVDGRGLMPVPDGVVTFPLEGSPVRYRLADGSATELDIAGLPDTFSPLGNIAASTTVMVGDVDSETPPTGVLVEKDGLRFEGIADDRQQTYALTDIATGQVLVSETAPVVATADGAAVVFGPDDFEHLTAAGPEGADESLVVLDPRTGEELTRLRAEELADGMVAWDGRQEATLDPPNLWVIASSNGIDWIAQQVDVDPPAGTQPVFGYLPDVAVQSGATVLLSVHGESSTIELP